MKRGSTEVETLFLNGWRVGDILEGTDKWGTRQLLITSIGLENFLCKWWDQIGTNWLPESGCTTLNCREWKRVGRIREFQTEVYYHEELDRIFTVSVFLPDTRFCQIKYQEESFNLYGGKRVYRRRIKEFITENKYIKIGDLG